MRVLEFNTAYTYVTTLYGINMEESEFESIGRIAHDKIGNKPTEHKTITFDTSNCSYELPCDVKSIEGVYSSSESAQGTSSVEAIVYPESNAIEEYIEERKTNTHPLYFPGQYLKYTLEGTTLRFDRNYENVMLVYRAELTDSDGLPYINEKEAEAIAAFCAYVHTHKKALLTRDPNIYKQAQFLQQEWGRLCARARTPIKVSQNDMDNALNAFTHMDRKMFNKSYKPMR